MKRVVLFLAVAALACWLVWYPSQGTSEIPDGRSEVVFWHFWGGEDRAIVEDVVRQFNESQDEYYVRAVAMPGNNLQAKLFLSVAGGDPPDLVNQDDPVIADWAERGVIQSLNSFVAESEIAALRKWWLPAAERLSVFDGRVFGICNGLDIRALFFNRTMLQNWGLEVPGSIRDLDQIAETIAPPGKQVYRKMGYLPDSRRLLAWGAVFGGKFYDSDTNKLNLDSSANVAALDWMSSYQARYGSDQLAGFRKTDQSLPGGIFPLLPVLGQETEGRYAVVMDGQWRVRNIEAFQKERQRAGLPVPEFGVCPLPKPDLDGAQDDAGWVNGNFFVVPKGAKNPQGAWAFAQFWIGYAQPKIAAETCCRGGWIPVSQSVVQDQQFQDYLDENPMFRTFVDLANSPNQFPTPPVVGAGKIKRALEDAGYRAMYEPKAIPEKLLRTLQLKFEPVE